MKTSAGILVYKKDAKLEVLLVHPGGPYFAKKDSGVWSIPKGEIEEGEDPLEAAKREFQEELGRLPPEGEMIDLGTIRQAGGKVVAAWAVEGDIDSRSVICNTVKMEWPPRSRKIIEFPENDKTEWFRLDVAAQKINHGQIEFLRQLAKTLGVGFDASELGGNPPQQSLF